MSSSPTNHINSIGTFDASKNGSRGRTVTANSSIVASRGRTALTEREISSQSPGSLRLAITPKNIDAKQRANLKTMASGIQKRFSIKNDDELNSKLPNGKLEGKPSTKLPTLKDNHKLKTVGIINNHKKENEEAVVFPKKRIPSISLETRRKSTISMSIEQLRNATVKNMIMPEDFIDINEEAVSFSLSSRLRRRKTVVVDEENTVISSNGETLLNQPGGRRRKFGNILKTGHNIIIVQEPIDESAKLKTPDSKSSKGSSDVLSKNSDGTQTFSHSANGREDTPKKKTAAATVTKPSSKNKHDPAPAGSYMGIQVHSKLMCPPFPFPSKHQILFGPYETPLLEVEEYLCIQHLFHKLDYYYMPTDPIRKSLLDPKMFKYAVEPIYNDKHIAAEVLNILPTKIHS